MKIKCIECRRMIPTDSLERDVLCGKCWEGMSGQDLLRISMKLEGLAAERRMRRARMFQPVERPIRLHEQIGGR